MILFCLWSFYRRGVTIVFGAPMDPSGYVKGRTAELEATLDRLLFLD